MQAHQRVDAEANRLDRGRMRILQVVGGDAGERAGFHVPLHHGGHGVGGRLVREQAERLGGAPVDQRIRIGERRLQRVGRRGVADEAHRKGGHLPHFWIVVAGQHRPQRRHAGGETDASDCQGRTAADARFPVGE